MPEVHSPSPRRGRTVLLGLFVLFCLLWVAGFVIFHIAAAFVHILLIIALVLLIAHFLKGRQTA
jgi:hypothetical protein